MRSTNVFNPYRVAVCLCLLFAVVFCLFGCAGPGRTVGEVHRRHVDVIDTASKQLQDDIDSTFLFDRPSRLGDKYTR